VTFSRRAVREIFGLPPDLRPYFLLKAGDLLAATIFGLALLLGGALGAVGTWALDLLFSVLGLDTGSALFSIGVRVATLAISFALNAAALAVLYRFLTAISLRWRTIWPGALLAGLAVTLLQLGAGWLLSYTPTNVLLATFAVFIGLLLWFRLIGIIMLVGAAWVAVSAKDDDLPLLEKSEAEQLAEEHAALLVAAHVRLRTAREARDAAPWIRRWAAERDVRRAERELAEVEASAPSRPTRTGAADSIV
jgi:membrane protein